jgi:hypothetical protein
MYSHISRGFSILSATPNRLDPPIPPISRLFLSSFNFRVQTAPAPRMPGRSEVVAIS